MGKLIKINIYDERKRAKEYNRWLERTANEDVVENYKKFLSI